MTNQTTERAREILARHEDWGRAVPRDNVVLRVQAEAAIVEALTPQTSEEVVEAVAALKRLVDAAHGLSLGVDWNKGTAAKYHRRKLLDTLPEARAAIAAMPSILQESADSNMSRAELLWANLPTTRPWTSLATHEKALVYHQVATLLSTIPQESDAGVTEAMLSAGRKYLLRCGIDDINDREVAGIYTAMTSARDREQPK